jgi:hypothetical protein
MQLYAGISWFGIEVRILIARETDETRNFALRDRTGTEIGVFSGRTPRQAALKASLYGEPIVISE